MLKSLMFAATAATLIAPLAHAESPEQPYRWTCKVGFYTTKVTPDGQARTDVDFSLGPIIVTVKPRSEAGQQSLRFWGAGDNLSRASTHYTIAIEGRPRELFGTDDDADRAVSAVEFHYSHPLGALPPYPHRDLSDVAATYWVDYGSPRQLLMQRADKDWTIILYMGGLRTDMEARHLNITMPHLKYSLTFSAEASVTLLTGPCVQTS
jgi:hypothetical protein